MVSAQAQQAEHDGTCNVYTYAKLHHQKRPGCWQSVADLHEIYSILAHQPADLELLKCTEIRTELDDLTTVTPDLYSKICSNGNISSSLNANPGGAIGGISGGMLLLNGGGGGAGGGAGNGDAMLLATGAGGGAGGEPLMAAEEFSVVVTEPATAVATNIDV